MKRTWLVYVGAGPGHELCNQTTEQDFYGPYTRGQAGRLKEKLNALFNRQWPEDSERLTAHAMPLETLSMRAALARYKEGQ